MKTIQGTKRKWISWVVMLTGLALACGPACADEPDEREVLKIKAAFVYNFVKYVQWPEEAFEHESSPIVIGVAGPEAFRSVLVDTVKDKRIGDRSLEVLRLPKPKYRPSEPEAYEAELDEFARLMTRCHVVYFGPAERGWVTDLYDRTEPPDYSLTIGDGQRYLEIPTIFDLTVDDGHVVFYSNHESIERTLLKISSKVLRLARETD